MDDKQDPESSVDENQFTGIDGNDSDEKTMDKLDMEVLVPPDLKNSSGIIKIVCTLQYRRYSVKNKE
jgi:hypothetical protein